ncbi:MAG TPA: FAD-dependent monooxygenase [Stellaceae bacterium]|nr:FAD-dependent monooxygenase [Stellaceae bacterium]
MAAVQQIAIIGGGIGGLAAALSLLRAGFDAHVYEQAPALGEIGAGIQIGPNASRILHRLGLAPTLAKVAVRPQAAHQRRWDDGRMLQNAPLGGALEAVFGAPYYHFHRADLLAALAQALPPERLHLDHRLAGLIDRGDKVDANFANGAQISATALVGADGIHSSVRAQLFGAEQPRFTGCIAYRGLVPAARLAPLALPMVANNWMGPGKHFVHYFVSAGRLVNFVAVIERDAWAKESWNERGAIADALATFGGWHSQVRAIIAAADETFVWGLFDRAPLARWTVGRVTLLGDAAHPMLPFMAQGAAQAIEDGATLAATFARFGSAQAPEALMLYETLRIPRASRLQTMSHANKTRFHLPDGPLQEDRDHQMATNGDRSIPNMRWLYEHDAGVLDCL